MIDNVKHALFFSHINKKTTFTDPRLAFAEPLKTSPQDFRQKFDGNNGYMEQMGQKLWAME